MITRTNQTPARKSCFKLIAGLFLCLAVLQARAQQPVVLSLDSAVHFALDHNKSLVNSKYAIEKVRQQIRENVAQGLPQIDASLDYTSYLGAEASIQFDPSAPPTVIEFVPTSNFQASVSQLIFNGNYWVGLQMLKIARSMTEQNYERDALNVKEQVTQAYYLILASERILSIIRDNKANAEVIYEKTTNLANAGILEETDAKKLSVMLSSVDNAMKSTERQVEVGYNLLRLQLGLESDQEIVLSTTLDEIVSRRITQRKPVAAFNINNNLDFKLDSIRGQMAKKQVSMQWANYLPTLVAYYSRTEKLKEPLFDMTPKNVLGFSLNIPVFSGGERLAKVKQAKIDYKVTQNTRELLKEQLSLQERQYRYNYNNLLEQYASQKANVEIAREVLDKMNFKLQQGVVSSLEITSANNDYLTAENAFTGVILQLLNAELSLRKINNEL